MMALQAASRADAGAAPLTIAEARRLWAAKFRECGIDSSELDARILIGHALGLDHTALAASSTISPACGHGSRS